MILFLLQNYALTLNVHIFVKSKKRLGVTTGTELMVKFIELYFTINSVPVVTPTPFYSSSIIFARYFILVKLCSSVFPVAPTSIIHAALPRC